jgi:putative endonuclease
VGGPALKRGPAPPDPRRSLGAAGERLALRHLEHAGYRILGQNVRLKSGEIDIVAEEGGCLVLVEVRLRRAHGAGHALESVARMKQERLRRLAMEYCLGLPAPPACVRIDVVAISVGRSGRVSELVLVQNAVEDG